MFKIAVIVCTHLPRPHHWSGTVSALRAQTFPPGEWELVIVGDEPTQRAAAQADLAWHPHVRQILQPPTGIAAARLNAMRDFLAHDAELLLFVDDDNLLAPDYLARGFAIAQSEPNLGCWGGQLVPQFAVPPPDWIGPFLRYIAVFPLERELRTKTFTGNYDGIPPTAGMFLRRPVVENFVQLAKAQPQRQTLGGTRAAPISGEDMDIGLSALDLGKELARFPQLKLTHLIPADRLTEEYIAKLLTSIRAGTIILETFRQPGRRPRSRFSLWRDWLRSIRLPSLHRKFMQAELRGEELARRTLAGFSRAATRS